MGKATANSRPRLAVAWATARWRQMLASDFARASGHGARACRTWAGGGVGQRL